jgi:hypothetical protein
MGKNDNFVGETLLLNGDPLPMVTHEGVEVWVRDGISFNCRYDQVSDPVDGVLKYRCLYETEGSAAPFVLVALAKDSGGIKVVLFDSKPS